MEIVTLDNDGTVTVRMTAQEAAAVRDDIGETWATRRSQPSDKLHSLLEWATPNEPA
jgi:hypothetical protein